MAKLSRLMHTRFAGKKGLYKFALAAFVAAWIAASLLGLAFTAIDDGLTALVESQRAENGAGR